MDGRLREDHEMTGRRENGPAPRGVDKRSGGLGIVPIGIEKVLVKAAASRGFRRRLLKEREAVLDELGEALSDTERTVLASIPASSLEKMVDRLDLKKHGKRKFIKAVAAAAFITAAGSAAVGCFLPVSTGVAPDEDFVEQVEDVAADSVEEDVVAGEEDQK
jgi:hypothetical protein